MLSRKKSIPNRLLRIPAGIFLMCCLLSACAFQKSAPEKSIAVQLPCELPPLNEAGVFPVSETEALTLTAGLLPSGQGLQSWRDLEFALTQSLKHVSAKPEEQVAAAYPGLVLTYGDMRRTLLRLLELLPRLDENPDLLARSFIWRRIGPDFGFTGYYEPTLAASAVRTPRFSHPLYKTPPELRRYSRKGRRYYSRHEIDCKGVLRNRGLELAWIEDPVDAFILQIQGSGRLIFTDGSVRYALYDGRNRHPYKSLGKVMKDRGLLPEDGVSMQAIREWLAAHPEQQMTLLDTNPSYVFFKLGTEGSFGSMGRILTPKVSVATDQRVLPNGLLTFMSVLLPDSPGRGPQKFQGVLLPQDAGGAIRKNRVDLFWGSGPEAERIAGYLDQKGAVFVLLARP